MVETEAKKVSSSKKISARVHCPLCEGRFVTDIIGAAEKGKVSGTRCSVCKKEEVISYLIFDRRY